MSKPIDQLCGSALSCPSPKVESEQKQTHFWQNVLVGSLSGMSAVSLIQPMIYFKNVKQGQITQADSPSNPPKRAEINPRVWYRGFGGFAASFAPTIAVQTVAKGIFLNIFTPLYASSAAGVASAIVVCPAEVVMIQQQQTGKGFLETTRHVFVTYGFFGFYRAFTHTAIREGAFAAAYLGAGPNIKERLQSLGVNEWVAQIIAGVVAGSAAAVVSHPFDTLKTKKQGDFSTDISMVKAFFSERSWRAAINKAFAGFGWRAAMIITATTVMPFVQEKLNTRIEQYRK